MKRQERGRRRKRRHLRVRTKIAGTAGIPRLNVFRSLTDIYAQISDDEAGKTLVAASSLDSEIKSDIQSSNKTEQAKRVGMLIAERAVKEGIEAVVFDRGGYRFHGRVKALAEAARQAGLKF